MLAAFVLQTQITKLALWPALTSDAAENDWTRTQSCGFFGPGGGEVGEPLGVGVGLGDVLELVLGSGLGLGLELAEPFLVGDGVGLVGGLEAELLDGVAEDVFGLEALGLEAGLVLDDLLGEADPLVDDDLLLVADLLDDGEVLDDLLEDDALLEPDVLQAAALW